MPYFRTNPNLQSMLNLFSRNDSWLICINADPDAMGAAMALKRIMSRKVKDVTIAKVNKITRTDNLALIRYTHIHMIDLKKEILPKFQKFAIVDSQPAHHLLFEDIPFSLIIDHHPVSTSSNQAAYKDIRPEYGATCTMMTEYLYNMKIRPGKLLATAMQFGIKTDTASFSRHSSEVDLKAYSFLAKYSDQNLLARIGRSEFHLSSLKYFAKALTTIYLKGSGLISYAGLVNSPDILVTLADLFMRIYELRWVAVCGVHKDKVVIIFRGDGVGYDCGKMAARLFGTLGSAGGHKAMARAEFPLEATSGQDPEIFVWQKFQNPLTKKNDPIAKNQEEYIEDSTSFEDIEDYENVWALGDTQKDSA